MGGIDGMMALLLVPPLLVVIGVFLLGQVGVERAVDLYTTLHLQLRRRPPLELAELMSSKRQLDSEEDEERGWSLPRSAWLGLAGGAVFAVLWHHLLLSPWFLVLGGASGWVLGASGPAMDRDDLYTVETFISAFRSLFAVNQSVFTSLEVAAQDLEEKSVPRRAVERAVERYHADADAKRALRELHEGGWPPLSRLGALLSRMGESEAAMMETALSQLEQQIRDARKLRDRAKTVLILNRITLRALQAANVVALVGVSTMSLWRGYYADRPLILMVLTAMALAGSWYFAGEVGRLGRIG